MDVWMDKWNFFTFYRTLSPVRAAAQKERWTNRLMDLQSNKLGCVLAIKAKDWCYDCSILSINTFAIILKRSEDEGTKDFVYKAITF